MSKKLPIYQQIADYLKREIRNGRWSVGERLPVESEFAEMLGVAVGTLRKSLSVLELDGFLERRQGSGTYVKKTPEGRAIYEFFHLESLEGKGTPSAEVMLVLKDDDCERLSLFENEYFLWGLHRKRFINQNLSAIEEIYFGGSNTQSLAVSDLHESLYLHYETEFNFWISRVEDVVDCCVAPGWVCVEMGLPAETILPRVTRTSWSGEDKIREISVTWIDYRAARYVARWR